MKSKLRQKAKAKAKSRKSKEGFKPYLSVLAFTQAWQEKENG
jgi:hypothetical protein